MKLGFAAAVAFCVMAVTSAQACPYANKTVSRFPPSLPLNESKNLKYSELFKFSEDCSYVDYWNFKGAAERHELKKFPRGWVLRAYSVTYAFSRNGKELIIQDRRYNGEIRSKLYQVE